MSKKNKIATILLLLILAFVAGAGIAMKFTTDYYEKLFDEVEFYNPAFNINETVTILRYLRTNQYEKAIHYTEWRLDDNLMNLSNSLGAYHTENQAILHFVNGKLKIAARYRKEFPYDIRKTKTTKDTVNKLLNSVEI